MSEAEERRTDTQILSCGVQTGDVVKLQSRSKISDSLLVCLPRSLTATIQEHSPESRPVFVHKLQLPQSLKPSCDGLGFAQEQKRQKGRSFGHIHV